jgi:hypothetical protein
MNRLARILVCSLLAALAACVGPGGDAERDTVALRFDWPIGLTAFVQTERSTRTNSPLGPTSRTVWMSYRIDVEEAEEGRLLRYGDVRAEDPADGRIYRLEELPERVAIQLTALFPSYVVSDEGRVVRLEGSEPMLEEAQRKLERQLAMAAPGSPEARRLAAASITEESLLAAVQAHWDELVGAWSGRSLAVGETLEREERLVVPRAALRIQSTVEFGVGQRIPCNERATGAECVEIEVRTRPLPDALDDYERAMRKRAQATGSGVLANVEIEESSYLVTEPATLIPHYLETTTKFRATVSRPGEPDVTIEDLDQTVFRYRYR